MEHLATEHLTTSWRLLTITFGTVPVLAWSAWGVAKLLRRRPAWGISAGAAWLIVTINLCFWGLVQIPFAPIQELFTQGRMVSVGGRAFLFGHGYWTIADGYWQHQTVIRLPDGTLYRGSTLDLLATLQQRGTSRIWGSWCYTGNYPYIRKDLITGETEPWPSYASHNTAPGLTIPIWVGPTFVRLGWPVNRYTSEPAAFKPVALDTLSLRYPSVRRVEMGFPLIQRRYRGLPGPDSVSWQPIEPDTLYSLTRSEYRKLSLAERRAVREQEREELAIKARTGLALYWIRGRAFPIFIHVPAHLYRPIHPSTQPSSDPVDL